MDIRKLSLECLTLYAECEEEIYTVNNSTTFVRKILTVYSLILKNVKNPNTLPSDSLKHEVIDSLDRIVNYVDREVMLNMTLNQAEMLLGSSSWKEKYAAIILLIKVSVLIKKENDERWKNIVDNILILGSV